MGGFFGTISTKDCVKDLFYGTDYNSHLGTKPPTYHRQLTLGKIRRGNGGENQQLARDSRRTLTAKNAFQRIVCQQHQPNGIGGIAHQHGKDIRGRH